MARHPRFGAGDRCPGGRVLMAETEVRAKTRWARTLRRNKMRACRKHRGVFRRSNATHRATQWVIGVLKWWKSAIYPPKPTVEESVSACFAVRQNGAGEHNDPVIAVALAGWWANNCPMSSGRTLPI